MTKETPSSGTKGPPRYHPNWQMTRRFTPFAVIYPLVRCNGLTRTNLLRKAISHQPYATGYPPSASWLLGELGLGAGSVLRHAGLPPGLSPLAGELAYYSRSSPLDYQGGAGGIRTRDLLNAIQARSQLRYGPRLSVIFQQLAELRFVCLLLGS